MKIRLLILFLIVGFVAAAQPSNYLNLKSRYRWIAGMADSSLHLPVYNGTPSGLRTGSATSDGAVAIDTANGVFYFYHNSTWKRVNIDTAAAFITSMYRRSDSVFYVKGGTHTFAFKDSTGGVGTGGSSDSSYIFFDTTYNRLGTVISADTSRVKSLRVQLNGSTVSPTETDSTLNWNLLALPISDTATMLSNYVRRQELADTAAAIRADFPAGGGGVSGSGTSGQIALWNGASSVTGSAYYTWSSSTSYPNITIGNGGSNPNGSSISLKSIVGDYAHVSTDGNQLAIYGLTGTKTISIYPYAGASASLLNLKQTSTGGSATFTKTVITVDTAVGGPSLGSIHGEYAVGDSTSSATDVGRHMFRGIGTTYANDGSFNTFYSSVVAGNTTYSQNHIINWQSDAKKIGANTLGIIYHLGILGDSINGGTVNHRWGVYMYDAIVKAGATLSEQTALRVPKLKSGVRNYDIFSDSAQTVKMDGNILLGDSALAASARKTIHFFNGTAPSSNISGAILYAESGELKVRDSGGNITTLSDPAGGSGTDNANVGSGYRWVKPSTQEIKTFFDGLYLDIDSSSNTDGLTVKVDTASMFPAIRSTIPASSGAQISGTPSANQMAFWASATEIKGSNAFTVSDVLYPSFQVGGSGTNEGTILVKDPAGTAGGMSGVNGLTLFSSSTYKQLDFYSHSGGSYLLQMKNNAGVLTADFQSNVAVTIASTLQVNTTIKQAGTASALTGYMLSNSGNLASTTNLNPGVLVYNSSNNGYGMDLGYNSSRYALRLFAPTSTGISFGRMGTGATQHSNFTESMYLNGSGNLGIGDATPASMLTVGNGDLFQVNSSGNIVKINNVTTSFPGSQGAANTVWQNDGSGNLSSYVITAGTQTPTATNGTNVSASTPGQEQYSRVGNVVTVSGFIEITCTSAGSSSDIDLSLPVASAFTTTTQLSGVILESVTGVASPGHGTVTSNSTNDRVTILFTPRATGSLSYRYTYSYQIL